MNIPEDAELAQRFKSLREDDRRAAPEFARTVSAGRRPRSPSRVYAAAAMLLAAGAAGALMMNRWQRPVAPPAAVLSWKSPTAFLLDTPGRQFLNETPRFGYAAIYGLPGAGKERR